MSQIIRGLAYLHEQELGHRDLKPKNILIHGLDEPIVKLADFGTVKQMSKESIASMVVGTADYVAPEVVASKPSSLSSDIFSLVAFSL